MVERNFHGAEGSETEGSSCDEFGFVVEAFDNAPGDRALGAEPVEEELAVRSQHARDFLDGFQAGTHRPAAPLVEKAPGPGRRRILPKELEVFLEQVGANRAQVVAQQIRQLGAFPIAQVLGTFEQEPAGSRQDWLIAVRLQLLGLLGANLVDCLAEVHHDVEAIEHVQRLARLLGDDLEVGLPQIATHELQCLASWLAEPTKEAQQGLDLALLTDPQQPAACRINLVDEGQVAMPDLPLDLVDTDRADSRQVKMTATPLNRHFYGLKDLVPVDLEGFGHLLPTQPFGPAGQKPGEGSRHCGLTLRPGHGFDVHPTGRTVDPTRGIEEEDLHPPQRNELETALRQSVVARPPAATEVAPRPAARMRLNLHLQTPGLKPRHQTHGPVDEARVLLQSIQDSLERHLVLLRVGDSSQDHLLRVGNGMLFCLVSACPHWGWGEARLVGGGRPEIVARSQGRCRCFGACGPRYRSHGRLEKVPGRRSPLRPQRTCAGAAFLPCPAGWGKLGRPRSAMSRSVTSLLSEMFYYPQILPKTRETEPGGAGAQTHPAETRSLDSQRVTGPPGACSGTPLFPSSRGCF